MKFSYLVDTDWMIAILTTESQLHQGLKIYEKMG